MSEKIYACLLRLFPRRFREAYGEEALQLFRDRTRDEKGFLRSLRLWLDLLGDLTVSIPREYRKVEPALVSASAQQRLDGAPSFIVLRDESPQSRSLILGGVFSLLALCVFSILLSHVGNRRTRSFSNIQRESAGGANPFAHARATQGTADDREDSKTASTAGPAATMDGAHDRPDESRPGDSRTTAFLPVNSSRVLRARTPQLRDDVSQRIGASVEEAKLDGVERHRVIGAVIANLKDHYVDADVARKLADALLAHEKGGDDDAATDGEAFAGLLTRQMRDESHDMHLDVIYSRVPLPDPSARPTPEDHARYRAAVERENCMFEKVEILANNTGYLKLNAFPDPAICRATATAAMARLNGADAIIFDLRDNRGGEPEMVALMAAYLFDHPEYWYNPRENTTQESWTRSPIPGNRLGDKPVYVLISGRTFSGAEQFCYDLKMLKRATLVGETTGGAAHSGVFHRIDEHFGIGIPETRPINPYGKTDWAETGVEPDVKVTAAGALEAAKKLVTSRLEGKK